jgi:hypothetical protein
LTLDDFVFTAYGRGYGAAIWSLYDPDPELQEQSLPGDYGVGLLMSPSAGWRSITVRPVNPAYRVWNSRWSGEVEANDLDSIQMSLAAGSVTPSKNLLLGQTYSGLELIAYRYNRWSLPVVDANKMPVDLPALYGNLQLSVRSADQIECKLDATDGSPTGLVLQGDLGLLTVEWPVSTGSGVADIYAYLVPPAQRSGTLYTEITGDLGGVAAKRVPIMRSSPLIIARGEVGT